MTTDVELIPRQVLFGNPEKVGPRISPDGARLAYVAPVDGVLNVWVGPVDGGTFAPVTSDSDRGIRAFFWAYDGRHLLYVQDRGGDENWRLHAVDLLGGGERDLTPFEGVQAQVVAAEKEFPDELLVGLNRDNPELHDVYRLDLRSGELDKVVENPGVVGWVVDAQFRVRGAVRPRPDGGMDVLVRSDESAAWETVLSVDAEDALTTSPITFDAAGASLLLMSSKDSNAGRLVRMDLADGTVEVLAEDPRYDVSDVLIHPDTREAQAAWFTRARREVTVLDPSVEGDLAALAKLHPGDFAVTSRDAADRTWLVAHVADDGPVAYHVWRRDTQEATFLFHHQSELARYRLAPMEPFAFTARDGLEIQGYVTFPPGQERRDLPTVLVVHGGPWARDAWGLNPEAQWLANRGYLCVQVNFRG
ncbi:MAG: S9 family peptidase, partial [Acidimicrobiia bacterium]